LRRSTVTAGRATQTSNVARVDGIPAARRQAGLLRLTEGHRWLVQRNL